MHFSVVMVRIDLVTKWSSLKGLVVAPSHQGWQRAIGSISSKRCHHGIAKKCMQSFRKLQSAYCRRPYAIACSTTTASTTITTTSPSLPSDFVQKLLTILPDLPVSTNKYDLERHGRGESYHPTAPPAAVLTPQSALDVGIILKLCRDYQVPVIPYGAGTSVEGHVCAISPNGSVSLNMMDFDSIELPDDGRPLDDFFVTVGAGVTRIKLNESLRHTGMQFMVDPGADATIGGMVACGASGTTAVKYGTMRENILSLECVLPDGTVAHCGSKALKSSAGYDLTSLMTGSEGTLGVITSVTIKLHPIPDHVTAAVCSFDTLYEAADAVATMRMSAVPLERVELLDKSSVAAFNQYTTSGKAKPMPEKPTLFLEFTGASLGAVKEQVDMAESICMDHKCQTSNFVFTANETERKALWSARHKLYYASLALRPGAKTALLTDACVPLSKFADLITATADDVKELNVVGPCFGHAGDGNFHCILPVLENDTEEYTAKLHQVNDNLVRRSMEVGGTCTGEHGVGYGKIKYLSQQYGEGGVAMMRMIKRSIDPWNIMNPGKVVIL